MFILNTFKVLSRISEASTVGCNVMQLACNQGMVPRDLYIVYSCFFSAARQVALLVLVISDVIYESVVRSYYRHTHMLVSYE